jgi:hypothetical protein
MSEIVYQHLADATSLDAWQPCDGHAVVTCKIRVHSGAYDAWETRTYEFRRTAPGAWVIDTNPGILPRDSWDDVVGWFRLMQPVEIDLVTTV